MPTVQKPPAVRAPRDIPSWYNDLDGSLAQAWAMIVRGAADRRAAFHTPVVATAGLSGEPSVRVMVLRAADPATRMLRVHTDARSAKLAHMERDPRVGVLLYDATAKLQLRLAATASVHTDDPVAGDGWARSAPQSRLCYEQPAGSGAPIEAPFAELPPDQRFAASDAGRANFAAIRLTIGRIEWLYLAIEGHRRAVWDWDGTAWQGRWLAP